jgi:hypothetical protein
MSRPEILKFDRNKLFELTKLLLALQNGVYHPSKYTEFTITDPKERRILALPYPDRVVHQFYVGEFIKPYFVPRFIEQSFACIPGRGSHKAADVAQKYLRTMQRQHGNTFYIVKMDIAKFFYNIDKDILFQILSRHIIDQELLTLTRTILYTNSPDTGIPIGNYTSQHFANIYLNELDQFVKRQLKIKYYLRYMDDFVMFVPTKSAAHQAFTAIQDFLRQNLKLELNHKSRYFPAKTFLDFCGYKIYPTHRKIRDRSKRSICQIIDAYENHKIDAAKFQERAGSWLGHASHADTFRYANKKLAKYAQHFPRLQPAPKPSNKVAKTESQQQLKLF